MNEEYDPTAVTTSGSTQYTASASISYKAGYVAGSGQVHVTESANLEYNPNTGGASGQSKLSQMTDEELLAIAGLNEQQSSKEVIDVDDDDIFEIPDEDEGIRGREAPS